jgi:dCMP deaminase
MKDKFKQAYITCAHIFANLSYAKRLKVGCVIVKNDSIISFGYNGTPAGEDNECEDEFGKTKDSVSHAEENAILKLATSSTSSVDATIFITHSPCIQCAKLIANAKISNVYYEIEYKNSDGIEYLKKRNIKIEKLERH